MGKILIDLRNTREEAISVAELKSNQDQDSVSAKSGKEDADYHSKPHNKNEDTRRSSTTSEKSMDQDDDDDKEPQYRLDPKWIHEPLKFVLVLYTTIIYIKISLLFSIRYANVKTPERHVRTRLYFTSVSFIQF